MGRLVAALGLLIGVAAPARASASWQFVATFPASRTDLVQVEATLRGKPRGPLRLCTTRDGAGQYIHDLQASGDPIPPDVDAPDCWTLPAAHGAGLQIHYRVDLSSEAKAQRDPDRALWVDGAFVFEEDALLLSPAPRPHGEYTVEFRLPPDVALETPWEQLAPLRFRTSWEQYAAGSYLALGNLRRIPDVPLLGGTLRLTMVGGSGRVQDQTLRGWVARAGASVAKLYRGLPAPRVETLLVAEDCADRGGVFGTTLRTGHPSLVLFYCGRAAQDAFADDWVATHELVHLGNPRLKRRLPWFTEGVATYYQDVLRGRSGARTVEQTWGDLTDGFQKFCAPMEGRSLRQESEALHQRHHYRRVYWGGACLFFQLDVAIRKRTRGAKSLDGVLRSLLVRGRRAPLGEAELIAALDGAAGAPIARAGLTTRAPVDLTSLYRSLGIEPVGEDGVRLHDDAPLVRLREEILSPGP